MIKLNRRTLLIACMVAFLAVSCNRKNDSNQALTGTINANISRLADQPEFIPLAPGAVTPEGWIADWAVSAAQGITGHLDEYNPTFGKAWRGFGFEARGATPSGGGWPLEQCSYWLDGAVRLSFILKDSVLTAKISARLDTVVQGVLSQGETFIYWLPKKELIDSTQGWAEFNTWAHSHMGRTLVAYYQATQKPDVLKALVKVYREFPIPALYNQFEAVSGAVNIEPMLDTYLMSGDTAILNNIAAFAKSSAYRQLAESWAKGKLKPGHNVIFYENVRVPAILSLVTGKSTDLEATLNAIRWAEKQYLLPIGLISGEEYHAGIGATRNVETCNVAAAMNTFNKLLQITGKNTFADRIEKIFFNAAPVPVSRDFATMCYYQAPNRYSSTMPSLEPLNPGKDSYQFTKIGHEVLCCVGNNSRVIPNYIMNMWMATADGGLASVLYGPCNVTASVADGKSVQIISETNYPFEEMVTMRMKLSESADFPVYLRMPVWCKGMEIKVNGQNIAIKANDNGFVKINRKWSTNDVVSILMPMVPEVIQGTETPYPAIEYFRREGSPVLCYDTTINNPYASVNLGPLVFSLPLADISPNKEAPGSKYNYALNVAPGEAAQKITVERKKLPRPWSWQPESPVYLMADAMEFDWQPTEGLVLPAKPIVKGKPVRIKLSPYGTTKFRVTMFPVSASTFIIK